MPNFIPAPDTMPDFPAYYFHVIQIRHAAKIEGRPYDPFGDGSRVTGLRIKEIAEAAPSRDAGVEVAESLLAQALGLGSISCNWSPMLGTFENPTSYETFIRVGTADVAPEALTLNVSASHGAWKAEMRLDTAQETQVYDWEGHTSREEGMAWCQEYAASWLRVDALSALWSPLIRDDHWLARIALRHQRRDW